jgi:hypothetical protein
MPISSNSSLLGVNAICKNLDKVIAEGRLAHPKLNEEDLMNMLDGEQFAESKWQARKLTVIE